MIIAGYARHIAADLTPSDIVDAETAALADPALLAAYCLAEVDASFAERVAEGDILVLEGALLDGPGAEAAIIGLQAVGVAAVICTQVAPRFAALGAGYGLPIVEIAAAPGVISDGALARVDLERGHLEVGDSRWGFGAPATEALAAVRRAQILARMRRVVEDEGYAE